MPADQTPIPQIIYVDKRGYGHAKDGAVYTPAVAGNGVKQNGPYSVIISYQAPTKDGP